MLYTYMHICMCGGGGRRWEDNIRMDLRKRGLRGVNWIHLTQDRDQCLALVTR